MVAIYYTTDNIPCGYMVYLISSDIMHIKEMIYLNRKHSLDCGNTYMHMIL